MIKRIHTKNMSFKRAAILARYVFTCFFIVWTYCSWIRFKSITALRNHNPYLNFGWITYIMIRAWFVRRNVFEIVSFVPLCKISIQLQELHVVWFLVNRKCHQYTRNDFENGKHGFQICFRVNHGQLLLPFKNKIIYCYV